MNLDIRSVWVQRPLPEARTFREIMGVHVDCCIQPDGSSLWAIRAGEGHVLRKDGQWVFEPQPSNRDDAFYRMYRWDTLEDAVTVACRPAKIEIVESSEESSEESPGELFVKHISFGDE
jgi:hypothetical protein